MARIWIQNVAFNSFLKALNTGSKYKIEKMKKKKRKTVKGLGKTNEETNKLLISYTWMNLLSVSSVDPAPT